MDRLRFEIFVDGGCPLCRREARWLTRLDRSRGRLRVTDIASPTFIASDHGIDFDAAMRTIQGRHPDGRVVHGVEVFRAAYAAVGLGWLWAPTAWPGLRPLCDAAYRVFARRRYARRLRQICPLPSVAAERVAR